MSPTAKISAASKPGEGRKPVGRPKGTGTQRVYEKVRDDILRLRLRPGADLDEATLEKAYGVSRTPVREALIRLASEDLITLLPNRGARVAPLDIADIPLMFEALELAQRVTLRWCAERRTGADLAAIAACGDAFNDAAVAEDFTGMGEANRAFHTAIGVACHNRFISDFYESQLANSLRLARLAFAETLADADDQSRYYGEVIRQHGAMIEAIRAGDGEAADALARDHVALFRERVMRYLDRSSAGSFPLD